MAHFAELDEAGTVIRVVVVDNAHLAGDDGEEQEERGVSYLQGIFGWGNWVQTSYSGSMRSNYAGIGHRYDAARDAFVAPKPFTSWVLDEETCRWVPPVPRPSAAHEWDEGLAAWVDATGVTDPVSFTLRFTATEQDRIIASTDPGVQNFVGALKRERRVRPKSPTTLAGLQYLEASELLDYVGRAAEILQG